MTLADKIIDLRKKNGWSQEELAEKLDVSRQSVSKWESGQSVPDINRILLLSDLFSVSTDYLLRDEANPAPQGEGKEGDEKPLRTLSMKEAEDYLAYNKKAARRIAIGVLLCILSPILLILASAMQDAGFWLITEEQATGLGLLPLILLVGSAVALFVLCGVSGARFEYLTKECFEPEYGVSGPLKEARDREQPKRNAELVLGIFLCVLSSLPLFIAMLMTTGNSNFRYAVASAALLFVVAIGVLFIVHSSILRGGYAVLLEEGDHARACKKDSKALESLDGIYWTLITAGYLAYSFITKDWGRSWIVWPIAAVLYGAIRAIALIVKNKKQENK